MTTLIVTFVLSCVAALLLTPHVRAQAIRLQVVDHPGGRRMHQKTTPRAGGVAIYLAFLPVFLLAIAVHDLRGSAAVQLNTSILALGLGASIVFALGLVDDVRGLSPKVKLLWQAVAAVVAWGGGVGIEHIGLPWTGQIDLAAPASLLVTVFWFLLLANAVNLIDGLDGLAAGIVFFASLTLLAVFTPASNFSVAIGLAALSGATLGFLRYNFNPASIFLGDSGSYLLGYAFAGLTVLGSIKTQAAAGLLIPIVALGVPLIDALWSPVRRFVLGRKIFTADMDHIHHRLMSMGWTTRKAVLVMYGSTVAMAFGAVLLTHARSERNAIVLIVISAAAVFAIRKLGYFDFVQRDGVRRWLGAVADEMGLARSRRAFLAREIEIQSAETIEELEEALGKATRELQLLSLQVDLGSGFTGANECRIEAGPIGREDWDRSRHVLVSMPLAQDDPQAGQLTAVVSLSDGDPSPNVARRLDGIRRGLVSSRYALTRALEKVAPPREQVQVG